MTTAEPVVHRYDDCPELIHGPAPEGDVVHADDEDERPVTCYYCRSWMGLED